MAKKRKYYVVWNGVTPGIYDSWTECQRQIKGYPGALYKSFPTKTAAETAYQHGYEAPSPRYKSPSPTIDYSEINEIDLDALSVDAACSGNPGIMEYRGVWVRDRSELFKVGPFPRGTNNIGEYLAIVHALALLDKLEQPRTTIYTDSRTALSWIRKKNVKTTLARDARTESLWQMIDRASRWIDRHTISHPLIKWDTDNWGEIPADFGRK